MVRRRVPSWGSSSRPQSWAARSWVPPSVVWAAICGAGISRSDVKELGELIDAGEAALLVVGASTLEAALDKAELKADKHIAKQLDDVSTADVDAAVKDAAAQGG